MGEPFFSLIVPVYNVEQYLKQCIDSIIIQDFEDYELILINDGSTDSCGVICDAYERADDRITVIHKKNGGLSDARNVGIYKARGKYIWFLDSDDYLLEQSALTYVSDIIKDKKSEVVVFSYKKYYENSNRYSTNLYEHVPEYADIREWIKSNIYKALACNKVVRTSLIKERSMQFPVNLTGEDLVWCADLLSYAKKISLCKCALMAYRQRMGSITRNMDKKFRMCHVGNALILLNEAIDKHRINKGDPPDGNLIGHYLAYEFSWLLGEAYPYWKTYRTDIERFEFLLNYRLSKKVAMVSCVKSLLGLRCASFILYLFIKIKKRKEI